MVQWVPGQLNKGMGRPTSCTIETIDKICESIANGLPQDTAARLAGISDRCFYLWMERAEGLMQRQSEGEEIPKNEQIFIHFFQEVQRAKDHNEKWHIQNIQSQAERSWQASAWLLERKRPDTWGRKDTTTLNHQGNVDVSSQITITDILGAEPVKAISHISGALADIARTQEETSSGGDS